MASARSREGIVVAAGLGGGLALVFLAQWLLGEHGPGLTLTPAALVAQGALEPRWVTAGGEWHRLASSVVLHADAVHAASLVLASALTGYLAARAQGWGWAVAAFALAGLAGSTAVLLTGAETPFAGAGGGALGLLAVAIGGTRHAAGPDDRAPAAVWVAAILALAGGLLRQAPQGPAFLLGSGLAAVLLGLAAWRGSLRGGLVRGAALACAAVLLVGTGVAFARRPAIARDLVLDAALAPAAALDRLRTLPFAQKVPALEALLASHPRDPRVRHYLGLVAEERDELPEAEEHLTRGRAEGDVLVRFFPDRKLEGAMRTALARIQAARGDLAAARKTLEPACAVLVEPPKALPAGLFEAACGKK